jgi:hypothetical protein
MRNMITVTSAVALLAFGTSALAQQQNAQSAGGGQQPAAGADIQVQQPEPNVTVQQGELDVTVERAGQPNINVVQPGQQSAPRPQEREGSQQAGRNDADQQQSRGADPVQPSTPTAGTDPMAPTAGIAPTAPMADPRLMGNQVSGMIGTNAVTTNNEDIGEIENLLISPDGQVEAAIIEWGGFLSIGSRTAAVPWNEFRLNEAGDRVVIDMTREEMEALPACNGDPVSVAGIGADAKPVQ